VLHIFIKNYFLASGQQWLTGLRRNRYTKGSLRETRATMFLHNILLIVLSHRNDSQDIQGGPKMAHYGCGGIFSLLLQIFSWFWQWKNSDNRPSCR